MGSCSFISQAHLIQCPVSYLLTTKGMYGLGNNLNEDLLKGNCSFQLINEQPMDNIYACSST